MKENLLKFTLSSPLEKGKKGRKVFESPVSEGNKHGAYPEPPPRKRKGRKVAAGPTMETKKHGAGNWQIVQGGGGNGS